MPFRYTSTPGSVVLDEWIIEYEKNYLKMGQNSVPYISETLTSIKFQPNSIAPSTSSVKL